jgi:hypothetical protein
MLRKQCGNKKVVNYQAENITYLITYLLRGAESFLRS